jgi:hypothetical protein
MYGCMDVWMYGCMDVWMYGCMDVWMNECMYVLCTLVSTTSLFIRNESSHFLFKLMIIETI